MSKYFENLSQENLTSHIKNFQREEVIYMAKVQKITPFFWFDKEAEDAAKYYVSVFSAKGGSASDRKNSKIKHIQRYAESAVDVAGKPAGSVMTVEFEIEGMTFVALNGGPVEGFKFSPATSFVVNCETQEEIDHFWEKLSARPEAEQCGWCVDKFGVTWQIVPTVLNEFLSDSDSERVNRVTSCFMQMKKFDIAKLKEAYQGK
jgi:predicted 3-demethylubiquinone-9 3-methyltransferase (glyoxalase superfamily)